MSAPKLTTYNTGTPATAITGDQLNTFIQSCDSVIQLRAFVAQPGQMVYVRGFSTINDGGQGFFYYALGNATDDGGITTVVPTTYPAAYWYRSSGLNTISQNYVRNTTTGQSTITANYTPGYVLVYLNGVLLAPSDYTATNGTTITLAVAAGAGDTVDVFSLSTISIYNAATTSLNNVASVNLAYYANDAAAAAGGVQIGQLYRSGTFQNIVTVRVF